MALALQQTGVHLVVVRGRQHAGQQRHRALVEHPGRRPGLVALDVAVGRVVGARGDAGELQRPATDPHAVVVAVGERDRTTGHDLVELGGGRQAAGERRHRPAAALDPVEVGVGAGVVGDVAEVGAALERQAAQVAPEPLEPALHRVDVRVGEAREEQPAIEVHDLRTGRRRVVTDRGDPAVDHDDVADPPAVDEAVEDRCVAEDRGAHGDILLIPTWDAPAARPGSPRRRGSRSAPRAARARSCRCPPSPGRPDRRARATRRRSRGRAPGSRGCR